MKLYRRLLASYLCVCIIPLLLSMFTIVKLQNNVQESILQEQESVIRATQIDMDRTISDADNMIGILSEEALITSFASSAEPSDREVYEVCQLVDTLAAAVRQQSSHSGSFCYFYRNGFFVSNKRTYHPIVSELFTFDLGLEHDSFMTLLEENRLPEAIMTVYDKNGTGNILVLRNIYDSDYKKRLACVGIIIQIDENLLQWENENSSVFMTDENGGLLYGDARAEMVCKQILSDGKDSGELKIEGEDYLYSSYPSAVSRMQYGFLSLKDAYYHGVQAMQRQVAIECVVYLVIGVISVFYLSRKTWSPLESVARFVKEKDSQQEYSSIKSFAYALRGFAEEKESLENQLKQSKKQTRIGYIARYLTGATDDPAILSQYIEEGQPYRLLRFSIIDPEKSEFFKNVPAEKQAETMEVLHFAVRNILEETFFDQYSGVCLELDNSLVMLIQEPPSREEVQKAAATVQEALSLSVCCYMSDPCLRLTDAPSVWLWTNRAYLDDIFWQAQQRPGVWMSSDVLQNKSYRSYGDFLDRQKKLAGYLSGDNYMKARKCLESIIEEDLLDRTLPFELIRHRYAGVAELLLSCLSDEKRDFMKDLSQRITGEEIRDQLLSLFDQIRSETVDQQPTEGRNSQWVEDVQQFIRDNCANPALNASMIADHLSMNLSTLSRRYKNTVGHGVLDEVHMVRLEAAKKLLSEGKNVRETAELTGYIESRALIRAFKRYEGVTPGQYAGRDSE